MKIRTVYCYLGLWSVKIRTMSAGISSKNRMSFENQFIISLLPITSMRYLYKKLSSKVFFLLKCVIVNIKWWVIWFLDSKDLPRIYYVWYHVKASSHHHQIMPFQLVLFPKSQGLFTIYDWILGYMMFCTDCFINRTDMIWFSFSQCSE